MAHGALARTPSFSTFSNTDWRSSQGQSPTGGAPVWNRTKSSFITLVELRFTVDIIVNGVIHGYITWTNKEKWGAQFCSNGLRNNTSISDGKDLDFIWKNINQLSGDEPKSTHIIYVSRYRCKWPMHGGMNVDQQQAPSLLENSSLWKQQPIVRPLNDLPSQTMVMFHSKLSGYRRLFIVLDLSIESEQTKLVGGFNPSEKYESLLGLWHSQYMEK